MDTTETMPNGAIIFDRFDLPEQAGSQPAEMVFCFIPENRFTPFVVWHRVKRDGSCYWGHYHKGSDLELAMSYFKDRKAHYMQMRRELAEYARKLANGGAMPLAGEGQ